MDVASAISALPEADDDGERWDGAWLVVRAFTEPVALLKLPMADGGLTREALSAAILRECGPLLKPRIEAAGGRLASAIPRNGFRSATTPPFVAERDRVMRVAPSITVAICTRNRPQGLERALRSLAAQEHPPARVLVVDNAPSDDASREVVERLRAQLPVDYVVEERPGLSWARNRAIEEADTDVIAWIDDDEEADPWWVSEVSRGFVLHPEADAVSGMVVPAELSTPAQWWFEAYGGHSKARGFTAAVFSRETWSQQSPLYPLPPFGVGANMAFRVGALERIGRFDCALGAGTLTMGGEDTAAFSALLFAGGTVAYQPTALVRHWHRRDGDALERVFTGYGRGLTAFYMSVVLRTPRAIPHLLRLVPRALRDVTSSSGDRLGELDDGFPRELIRANLRGMLQGPILYMRARARARRLVRSTGTAGAAAGGRDPAPADGRSRMLVTARLGAGGAVLAAALALAQLGRGASLVGILAIALFGLGPAATCWLDAGDGAAQLALTIALSLAGFALCAALMIWAAFWHPMLLVLLSVPTVVSCLLRLRRLPPGAPELVAHDGPQPLDAGADGPPRVAWPFR